MWLRLAISLVSAAAIAYEVLLIRLLSIIQWHHFAYLVISLALLGYGASGTLLSLLRERLLARFEIVFLSCSALFSALSLVCFAVAQRLPLNPLEIVWEPRQLLYLALLQLVLAVPFFCAATAIGLTLVRFRDEIPRIYRADLVGAGCGAALIVLALTARHPARCLVLVAATPMLAAVVASLDRRLRLPRWTFLAAAAATLSVLLLGGSGPELVISEYKALAAALRVPESRLLLERSSPLALLSVVDSPRVPVRHAPGLSLAFDGVLPRQLAIYADGGGLSAIDRRPSDDLPRRYLDYLPSALAYHLLEAPRVVVFGAGGGGEVRAALDHGASEVQVVEPNPQVAELLLEDFRDFAGDLYRRPRVSLQLADARGFLARTGGEFDLLQIARLDGAGGGPGGVYGLSESYLYTEEALAALIGRLADGGILSITRSLDLPPRDSLKLAATAIGVLERTGLADPATALALIRSWDSVVLLVRRGPFTRAQIDSLRAFCRERSFDTAFYPGMPAAEANRYNLLPEPYLHRGIRSLLGAERERFVAAYKFDLRPATDDRPYFFHFFRWRALPELWSLRVRGGASMLEWAYLFLLASLVTAGVAGAVLILVPLRFLGDPGPGPRRRRAGAARTIVYFLGLGLGFLFIEIAFIQRFVLFLAHPLYAVAVVLAAFLVFAGLGSGVCRRWDPDRRRRLSGLELSPIDLVALAIAALALVYVAILPRLLGSWAAWELGPKVLAALSLLAPLAFLMGMPFPMGLRRLAASRPGWIPWAWAINGWASVLAALLAHLIAVHFGFSVVVALAAVLYPVAALALRGLNGVSAGGSVRW